ncbi:MAG: hypothetical protein WA886_03770, partial [Candidatus Acidiferrales bacterium]
ARRIRDQEMNLAKSISICPFRLSEGTTPALGLKAQINLLIARPGFAIGALAHSTFRWERRSRGEMIISQRIRYQRIGKSLAAILAG